MCYYTGLWRPVLFCPGYMLRHVCGSQDNFGVGVVWFCVGAGDNSGHQASVAIALPSL